MSILFPLTYFSNFWILKTNYFQSEVFSTEFVFDWSINIFFLNIDRTFFPTAHQMCKLFLIQVLVRGKFNHVMEMCIHKNWTVKAIITKMNQMTSNWRIYGQVNGRWVWRIPCIWTCTSQKWARIFQIFKKWVWNCIKFLYELNDLQGALSNLL